MTDVATYDHVGIPDHQPGPRHKNKPNGGHVVWRYVFASIMAVWILAPFYLLFLIAVQSKSDALKTPPNWLPKLDFDNFTQILSSAFKSGPAASPSDLIIPGLQNSTIVALSVGVVNIILGSTAGYAFARYRFLGSRSIPITLLGSQMVPAFALLVPLYTAFRSISLTNTTIGIVIADLGITLPFSVYLFRAYFATVPIEIERAAKVDGANRWKRFYRVALPLIRPGLISAGLFAFMVSWNDFVFAIVLNNQQSGILLQPAIAGLYNVREQSFGLMAAGSLLSALPTMLIAVTTQRYLIRGLLSGTGKG